MYYYVYTVHTKPSYLMASKIVHKRLCYLYYFRSHYNHIRYRKIFLFTDIPLLNIMSNVATQPRIQWVPGALSSGVKRQGREADHSPPASAEVKKRGSIHPLPHTPSWRSA
jgi:hypothetical protein